MDIVRFKGGLGNQMFQYALVESLRSRGREVYCNFGFYRKHPELRPFILNNVFNKLNLIEISDEKFEEIDKKWNIIKKDKEKLNRFLTNLENRFFYVENKSYEFDEKIFMTNNCVFVGYWQTEKYFLNISQHIKKLYVFENIEPCLYQLGKQLEKGYIGIHIRRGDYLKASVYNTFSMDYYYRAIEIMERIIGKMRVIFFSDDKSWVKNNFDFEDMIICESNLFEEYQDWYDMYLMTLCRGNIIANSSFSWWGAWLNENPNSIVIAPNKWLEGYKTPDVWCDKWIRI